MALVILAALWSVSAATLYWTVSSERQRAEVIAMAAEQATLSQRIAFLTSQLDPEAATCNSPAICDDLLQAAERLDANHALLSGQSDQPMGLGRFIRSLAPLYDAGSQTFRDEVQDFADAACRLARDALAPGTDRSALIYRIRNGGNTTMMQGHGLLVEVLEADAKRAIELARNVTVLSWLLTIAMVIGVSARIFRPMAEKLGAAMNQMEAARAEAEVAALEAAKANKARGEFLKTASHELKTPLNAIMGLAEVIREDRGAADRLLKEMAHASDHLLVMLNTILDTHRLDEGRLDLHPTPTPLAECLRDASEIGHDLAVRKSLGFTAAIDVPDDFIAEVDAGRLAQICLNLLDNAVRYTSKGDVSFAASLKEGPLGHRLTLTVEDTGIGISKQRLTKLFTRFESAPSAPGSSGFGLGLALVKTLVTRHGGDISVASKLGEGTRITLELNMPRAVLAPNAGTLDGDVSVLIVDDNQPNRLVAEAMMAMLGTSSDLTEDGQQAVACAMKKRYDLILMDIAMPVMDGVEATEAIRREDGPNKATPIVAVTAHVAPEDVGDYLNKGFQAVIHKPIRKALMADVYDRYVRKTGEEEKEEAKA
ncbi:response regulator [Parvularcula sp. ZS-1/3]|uniref:histidine kinase n=1 Tax=Parvularcula mediterranea TaxID=2732508 RepID=A0A7Y3RMD0_9PROT|nr:ATP-binding protein [Parvularcula mediterranea]NNU16669.1 response regulator [Parvularcula mediterranea]